MPNVNLSIGICVHQANCFNCWSHMYLTITLNEGDVWTIYNFVFKRRDIIVFLAVSEKQAIM